MKSGILSLALMMAVAPKLGTAAFDTPGKGPRGAAPAGTEIAGEQRNVAEEVQRHLRRRLADAASRIEVQTSRDGVALNGSVETLPEKYMAEEAAAGVRGVQQVANNLRVTAEQRSDADLARDVASALQSDPATLAYRIEASARDGIVTLRGTVDTVPQKRIAAWVASGIRGVREIDNQVRVNAEKRSDRDIQEELVRHFATSAIFNDDDVHVQVNDGVVALSGQVDTALEKNWAREEAWARGVRQVVADQLGVIYTPSLSRAGRATPLSDEELRRTIIKAFVYDPRVASAGPEVAVNDGKVTLQGVVSNRRAKQAAVQIARNTGGVVDVVDRLEVRADQPQSDSEIASAVQAALRSSAALADDDVQVDVRNGRVTLSGAIDSDYERWVAGDLASRTRGVVDVENKVALPGADPVAHEERHYFPRAGAFTPWVHGRSADEAPATDEQLAAAVRRQLAWSPFTDGEDVRVSVERGAVALTGEVESWAERNAASANAYEAGARTVVNQLQISRPR